ncbi:TetR/AcrR family transcriptional regulator [Pseudomonas typographi]|uniref:TetR/AcrR family transcriptional regulator n=1 Tax=Pseudomonas typographi TaxID=2715964 RepID=A0ABR7YWJ1_9PSED|nr:TetR/AcrR family transcriptional regulator [Pseudomonas typographi]MBD1585533.1 TetR/AcrR family transcriptional regulator [Pseudomonas typographi]MBD1597552.1 TetR/AcrR family transcriptional regulator [Pseudomonas typographi]
MPSTHFAGHTAKRAPQQTRGRERVSAILDACATLLANRGATQLTMHGLAKEANTSIGSLYHFFADKQAVLHALGVRHLESIAAITHKLQQVSETTWRELPAEGVIDYLMMPILRYIETHPDFMLMISSGFASGQLRAPELRKDIEHIYDHVLAIRMPTATDVQRGRRVKTLMGMPLGLLQMALENDAFKRELLLEEAPAALAAYLRSIELG